MESFYQVKIISTECLNDEVYELTDEVCVPTITDAVNLVSLLANMHKDIMSVKIQETFDFNEHE